LLSPSSSALNPVVSKASAGALEVMNIQSLKHDTLLEKCLVVSISKNNLEEIFYLKVCICFDCFDFFKNK
jgi:tRNA G18 (ribose-2'-O)-methylase SpoU